MRFLALTGGLAGVGRAPRAFAQGSSAAIEYGIAGLDALHCAAYSAFRRGEFDKHGLKASPVNTQSGPRGKQMLAAGQLFAVTSGCNDSIALTLAGKPSVLIYGFDKRIAFANLLVNKDDWDSGKIRTIADLAGKPIAVTQPQAATWLMAVYLTDKAGIKAQIRGLGDFATMLGALKSRQVSATIATLSMLDAAKSEGWAVPLFQATATDQWNAVFGGDVPGVGVYMLADTVKERRADVQAFVDAMVAGQDFVNAASPEQIAELVRPEFLSSYPMESVVAAIKTYKDDIWTTTNLITEAGFDRLLGIMKDRQIPEADMTKVSYDNAVDMSFVKKARGL